MLLSAVLLVAACLPAQNAPLTPASPPPVPSLAEAQRSFAEKRYTEAAALCAAIAEHAADPQLRLDALSLQAKSLINANDFPSAETILNRYLFSRPQSAEALYLLGYVLERENKARESLPIYTRAAALAPPSPNDLKLVALDYVLLNDYPDAILWLKRSLAEDPANAEAWYFLGRAHMQQGNFVEAEKAFRHTLALTPGDPKALDNLGLSLEAQNRNPEAVKAYAEAVAHQKSQQQGQQQGQAYESEQPLLHLGTLLNNENRSAEALPYLQRAVELAPQTDPSNARCYAELSHALVATGDPKQGLAAMERAVALDPANPSLHFLLGQLYRNAGQAAKASVEFETSKRLYGSHSTDQHP